MREPLPGWTMDDDDAARIRGGVELLASKTRWMMIFRERSQTVSGHHLPPMEAQLAAEDAARAMVADMAAALGGSVTWATEGGAT